MPIRKSTLLSKEEAGLQLSPELALMLGEYQRTKFLVDIDQIRSRTEGTE
jgi:hypothetical protein